MYHAIVRRRVRALWREIGAGRFQAAVAAASPSVAFEFVGTTELGARTQGQEAFASWFSEVFELFPNLHFEVDDVASRGWPWDTRVAVRLTITATLTDETSYRNVAVQWMTLRWGALTSDWVLEDTAALAAAIASQRSGES